jgi:hypothetical protein
MSESLKREKNGKRNKTKKQMGHYGGYIEGDIRGRKGEKNTHHAKVEFGLEKLQKIF